jgi:hypothetical protein
MLVVVAGVSTAVDTQQAINLNPNGVLRMNCTQMHGPKPEALPCYLATALSLATRYALPQSRTGARYAMKSGRGWTMLMEILCPNGTRAGGIRTVLVLHFHRLFFYTPSGHTYGVLALLARCR